MIIDKVSQCSCDSNQRYEKLQLEYNALLKIIKLDRELVDALDVINNINDNYMIIEGNGGCAMTDIVKYLTKEYNVDFGSGVKEYS